jgi:hypothetical protein
MRQLLSQMNPVEVRVAWCGLLALMLAGSLLAQSAAPTRVELGLEDRRGLIGLLSAKGYDAVLSEECCDEVFPFEDAQSVWIGKDVPYERVKEIVLLALERYPHLLYYRAFRTDPSLPVEWDRQVFVGASKSAAQNGTLPLPSAKAKALFQAIRSRRELDRLLDSLQK